jgi:phospholipid transport system transporter-binding protein
MTSEPIPNLLSFDGSLRASQSEALHQTILDALRSHASVVIDCSKADDMDVAFLQILIGAARTASAWRKDIRLASPPSDSLAETMRRCGFPEAAHGTTSLTDLFSLQAQASS